MTLEKDIERKLTGMITKYGGRCLKWICPGWTGVPDRIILLPGGRIYFIELKRPKGGKYSKMQDWWRDTMNELGCNYYRIKNAADLALFEIVLQEDRWEGPTR